MAHVKKIAVILAGCGHRDGAEITEAVSLLVSLNQEGAETFCFAPDMDIHPINHLNGETETNQKRNLLQEAARIARGKVKSLVDLQAKNFDGLALAGGMGASLHLSNWNQKKSSCDVHPEVTRILKDFYSEGKPIAAVCIAPAVVARVLGSHKISLTLGDDPVTIKEVEKTGAIHIECPVDDFITDRDHKIITTPAYMHQAKPHEIFKGISGLAHELVEMA